MILDDIDTHDTVTSQYHESPLKPLGPQGGPLNGPPIKAERR